MRREIRVSVRVVASVREGEFCSQRIPLLRSRASRHQEGMQCLSGGARHPLRAHHPGHDGERRGREDRAR